MKRSLIAALGLTLLLSGCAKEEAHVSTAPTPPVVKGAKTLALAPTAVREEVEALGTVKSRQSVALSTKLMGKVAALGVKVGDRVKAGQEIARIEAAELDAQLAKARAGMREADEGYAELDRGEAAAANAIQGAEAQEALAKATFERFKTLAERGSLSRQEYDEAQARYKASAAETRRAKEMKNAIAAKRGQLAARREQAAADEANVKAVMTYAVVTAPISGIVVAKPAEVGMMAAPGMTLAVIEDEGRYRLEASVDESMVSKIKTGDVVTVRIEAVNAEFSGGRVDEVTPSADAASRTLTVKISLDDQAGLRPGLFGRVRFPGEERQALLLPKGALVERGQLTGVFVVDAQKTARFRLVKAGREYPGGIEVASGLSAGETIVSEGASLVSDGARLE